MKFKSLNKQELSLMLCLFLSGFGGLLYHVVWQRMLGFFAGGEVVASTIVITAFLTGLGVGTFVAGKFADRLDARQALIGYGLAEISIATFGVFSKFLFYDFVYLNLRHYEFSLLTIYFILFICMLIPTFLMGITLPLISRTVADDIDHTAQKLSLLNSVNIWGSVFGCFISGWILIGIFGYANSIFIGGAINFFAGFLAIYVATVHTKKYQIAVSASHTIDIPVTPAKTTQKTKQNATVVPLPVGWGFAGFVSGFLAISLEIVWFRLLDIYIKSNSYLFAHLLAFVLTGYAIGNMLGSRFIARIKNETLAFWGLQFFVVFYVLLSNFLIAYWYPALAPWMHTTMTQSSAAPGYAYFVRYLVLPTIILLPPNILIGAAFPIVQKAIQTSKDHVGRNVSFVLSLNLLGNILGGLVCGLIFLNVLGTPITLFILSGAIFFISLVYTLKNSTARRSINWIKFSPVMICFFGTLLYFKNHDMIIRKMHEIKDGQFFIFKEDASAVTSLIQIKEDKYRIFVNGLGEGQLPFIPFHVYLGSLPSLVHPQPKNALVIGLGSGGTSYGIGINPNLSDIKTVEIVTSEKQVIQQASQYEFGRALKRMFSEDRYKMIFGDGRKYLAISEEKFDLIEIDAIQPRESHSGILYSQEFYEEVKNKLKPGGIFTQWKPTNRVEKTVLSVFPYVIKIDDAILLASAEPILFDKDTILKRLREPSTQEYLNYAYISLADYENWLIQAPTVIWTPSSLNRDIRDINTDLHPRDEFYLNNK